MKKAENNSNNSIFSHQSFEVAAHSRLRFCVFLCLIVYITKLYNFFFKVPFVFLQQVFYDMKLHIRQITNNLLPELTKVSHAL